MGTILLIAGRTLILYAVILVIFRLMGKREIGELSVLDLVVFIMIGELAVLAIEEPGTPLVNSVMPMGILLLIQIGLAFLSLSHSKVRKVLDGKPSIIIKKGKIDEKAMREQRYNFDDLLTQLRLKDINNIADVEYAILETSGQLSVIKKDSSKKHPITYTQPFIVDGVIQEENLKTAQKGEQWLRKELKSKGYEHIDNISFCSYQDGEFYIDKRDEKE
ncbi:DUF421 domain-containing protein [Heyndrickxia acidicola]|uniref:DUF421 domain-containing protein n=1 Tax=Heyndrickxia acidicola TaxID=209389 RepID=A0ABU6MJB2_9BACI|nr:DUF421 domain-containing protein [Heyndrickxia acidicola]MED1204760.1 DUF421 domain-containing protein [Heyndrickxia acidicola]